jgi:hypothetical protein
MFSAIAFALLALATHVFAANICGSVGIHNDTKIDYYMGDFFYKGPNISIVTLCASWCKKDAPKCKAFRWSYYADSASQYCEFFDNGLYVESQSCSQEVYLIRVDLGTEISQPTPPNHTTTTTSAAQSPHTPTYLYQLSHRASQLQPPRRPNIRQGQPQALYPTQSKQSRKPQAQATPHQQRQSRQQLRKSDIR